MAAGTIISSLLYDTLIYNNDILRILFHNLGSSILRVYYEYIFLYFNMIYLNYDYTLASSRISITATYRIIFANSMCQLKAGKFHFLFFLFWSIIRDLQLNLLMFTLINLNYNLFITSWSAHKFVCVNTVP